MQPERASRRTITLDIPQPHIDWLDQQAEAAHHLSISFCSSAHRLSNEA